MLEFELVLKIIHFGKELILSLPNYMVSETQVSFADSIDPRSDCSLIVDLHCPILRYLFPPPPKNGINLLQERPDF